MPGSQPAYAVAVQPGQVHYPDSDGLPMADNTVQYKFMVMYQQNLDAILPDFVASNLLWYPVEGDPKTRQAPDVLVAQGRPKGDRGSYKQWEEGGIPPQVVIEVLSPGNTFPEMYRKLKFYERFGVEEYYVFDPDKNVLGVYLRQGSQLVEMELDQDGQWTSPRLGVRFHVGETFEVYRPDGQRFLTFQELEQRREAERQRAETAEQRAEDAEKQAETERQRAEAEHQRAEAERQRAEAERQRAEAERHRAEDLAARLRALGVEV